MRLLVWQWGRRGAGPRYALELARGLRAVPGTEVVLSLSTGAEIMAHGLPDCDLPVATYRGAAGWAGRLASIPIAAPALARRLRALRLDGAVCAMPAPLDLLMAAALHLARVPYAVTVHDATLHPGDILPFQGVLQSALLRGASARIALSDHVAGQLGGTVLRSRLSPLGYGPPGPPPLAHGGPLRLLCFGRLLPYKGLDLLADALAAGTSGMDVRVVGHGPEGAELDALRRLPGVTVENRWVPEHEVGPLLAWADALVLSHREASQSGVAATALSAGRWVVATRVGGLPEQLAGQPGAILCDPDPASLAAALRTLRDHPPSHPTNPAAPPLPPGEGRGEGPARLDDAWPDALSRLAADLQSVFSNRS